MGKSDFQVRVALSKRMACAIDFFAKKIGQEIVCISKLGHARSSVFGLPIGTAVRSLKISQSYICKGNIKIQIYKQLLVVRKTPPERYSDFSLIYLPIIHLWQPHGSTYMYYTVNAYPTITLSIYFCILTRSPNPAHDLIWRISRLLNLYLQRHFAPITWL